VEAKALLKNGELLEQKTIKAARKTRKKRKAHLDDQRLRLEDVIDVGRVEVEVVERRKVVCEFVDLAVESENASIGDGVDADGRGAGVSEGTGEGSARRTRKPPQSSRENSGQYVDEGEERRAKEGDEQSAP
jgi:hypothetical protein